MKINFRPMSLKNIELKTTVLAKSYNKGLNQSHNK